MNKHDHLRAAFRFLQLAGVFTIEQDALAKSEMLWCAAAHIVKSVAVQEGFPSRSHQQLLDAASDINDILGYVGAYSDFYAANSLHQNMYSGFMSDRQLTVNEERVNQFVNYVAEAITHP